MFRSSAPKPCASRREAKVRAIAVEAGRTLLLEKAALIDLAERSKISLVGR